MMLEKLVTDGKSTKGSIHDLSPDYAIEGIKRCGWFTLMVGPQGVKELKALKELQGTELETLM
jgi:hypothetical protein